ncbi:MAG: hypothetical protein AB8B91_05080 [Rubripirellula sp.]
MSRFAVPQCFFVAAMLVMLVSVGCQKLEPIVTYTIPTKVPEQLQAGKDRMLAAMVPKGTDVWFFKITGSEKSVASIETMFRDFVEQIEFADGVPVLKDLPEGWRRGGDKPMRYATIDVQTTANQLDLSVSKLGRQEDWDQQVKMNVNRWRGQLGLETSQDKWAEGAAIKIASADSEGIWVDIVGESGGASPMTPPFAGGAASPPFASANENSPVIPRPVDQGEPKPMVADERLKFDRPEGWRDGRMTSMRMAAFSVGPEEAPAELTVIPAGGDLRGNVARWLGQVVGGTAPDDMVDKALENAEKLDVDGRESQRFMLTGVDAESGTAIDATIVPIEGGMSLFVKMTGPVDTVKAHSSEIASFLESLKLDL